MAFLAALLALAFAQIRVVPAIYDAKGLIEASDQFAYAVSVDGAYRLDYGKPAHAPKTFDAAFVFVSESKFRVVSKPVERGGVTVVGDQVRYTDGFVVRKGAAHVHEVEAASALVVAPTGEQYLLVAWHGASSTLFRIQEDVLIEVAF
jgi:hypothetical protein